MQPDFEVRYLSIEWFAEGVPSTLKVAPSFLTLERAKGGVLTVETTIFKRHYPWIGIRITGKASKVVPERVSASGDAIPLMPVRAPLDGTIWWLASDGWDEQKKLHYSELRRSAGVYRFRIGSVALDINNQLSDDGLADVQAYVDDFRGNLFWMILNDRAGATAAGTGIGPPGEQLANALEGFARTARQILSKPAVTVLERTEPSPVSKVRATTETFREYARNPSARLVRGKVFKESADTAENRYLRHMLALVEKWIDAWLTGVESHLRLLGEIAESEQKRAQICRETKHRQVDPAVFDRQTEEMKPRITSLREYKGRTDGGPGRKKKFRLRLEDRYGSKNAFFYKRVEESVGPPGEDVAFRVVELPEDVFSLVWRTLDVCQELTFHGDAKSSIEETKQGKKFRKLSLTSVYSITPHKVLEERYARRKYLEKRGWIVDISHSERRDLQREARVAESRARLALSRRAVVDTASKRLIQVRSRIAEIDKGLVDLGVTRSDSYPTGMLFIGNPTYAACMGFFKKAEAILKKTGFDASLFEGIGRFGILHVSDIYEKWCLLKICSLLSQDLGFGAEQGWTTKLLQATLSSGSSVELVFTREDIGVQVRVSYQEKTKLGRRPDFVIRVFGRRDWAPAEPLWTVVLDAKFRTEWTFNNPVDVLSELVRDKKYHKVESFARVFVIQPCKGTMIPPASPLEWGRDCNYGASSSYLHRFGWVQAGVARGGIAETAHLKRLLGMTLQLALPRPTKDDTDNRWVIRSICLACGNAHSARSNSLRRTKRGKVYWVFSCSNCHLWTTRTHCYRCALPLFKNGTRWTYHETLADQVTNVICPKCGSFFYNTDGEPETDTYIGRTGKNREIRSEGASQGESGS